MPKLGSDLVGTTIDAIPWSWEQKDALLYAVGVGARPPEDLDFLFEGRGPKVLPTFGVIPGFYMMGASIGAVEGVNLAMILHGEQSIVQHRAIPPRGSVRTTGKITEVWDKGQAAVIGVEGVTSDDQGPLFTNHATIFVRGAGGFGGERGPSTAGKNAPPEREPDSIVEDVTRPEQAAIYRLSGDVNPLHIDPDFAKMAGFERPFIHGLCTFGFVGRAVVRALCGGDPAKFGSLEARFADQVYPGDQIITKFWKIADGEAIVQAETQNGNVVLSQARATYK
jgi:acyl dehydratase